jgi:hypothetical protein
MSKNGSKKTMKEKVLKKVSSFLDVQIFQGYIDQKCRVRGF